MKLVVVVMLLLVSALAQAHELIQKVSRGNAVVIELSHPDGSPFSHERFEIRLSGEDTPFQTGTSDALGRIVFIPDRLGTWRIRSFSEDGHGVDMTVDAGPEDQSQSVTRTGGDRPARAVFGVFAILISFMIVFAVLRRKRT